MYLIKFFNVFVFYYLEEINKSIKIKVLLCFWFIVFNDGIKLLRMIMIYLYKLCENINMKFENDCEVSSINMIYIYICNWKYIVISIYIFI